MDMLRPPTALNLTGNNIKNAFKNWKQKFLLYFEASGAKDKLTEKQQTALLLHSIGDEGLVIYNTWEDKEKLLYLEILKKLEEHCSPPSNETYNRHIFFNRKQKEGENVEEFVTELKKLSLDCNFDKLKDGLIRDQIIIGLIDNELKEELLGVTDLTLEKCINMSRAAETTKAQMVSIKNKSEVARVEIGTGQKRPSRPMKKEHYSEKRQPSRSRERKPSQANHTNSRRPCGKCGRQHGYAKCPAFNKKCVKCGKYNHFAAMCLNKTCGSV
ncbi:uncharacterized protein LOC125233211 [Leguminivora glycinivorella]|uniref:uncharacterized protein LOC125233211 n=1 Tax=Leguminivora glycinivorella TaxID=1035111 RepID=UPI00200C85F4|nr:uncharacterized protein LOC125233211 [Leguminivora glycinivorella]